MALTILLLSTCLIFGVLLATNLISSVGEEKSLFAPSVEFGGKTYTSERPLRLLDIVADECLSDYAYMTGADRGAVKWRDICALPAGTQEQKTNKKAVCDAFINLYKGLISRSAQIGAQLSNDGGSTWDNYTQIPDITAYLNSDTKIRFGEIQSWYPMTLDILACYELGSDNLLAYKIFDNFDMCDKFEVAVKSAASVTVEDIEAADAVYIDCGVNSNTYQAAVLYQKMYQSVQGTAMSGAYPAVAGITDTASPDVYGNNFTAEKDLSAPVAGKIFFRYLNQDIAFMCDALNGIQNPVTNIQKLYGLMVGINRDVLKEELCLQRVSDGVYAGTKGQLDLNTLTVSVYKDQNRDTLETVIWRDTMFGGLKRWPDCFDPWSGNYVYETPAYPYYNITCNQYNVNENLMIWGAQDSTFGAGFLTNEKTIHESDFIEGTTVEEMVALYGTTNEAGGYQIDTVKMLLYILGGYRNHQKITSIRVLEIEPAGAGQYDTYEGAQKIAAYFGAEFDLTEENYRDYVRVTPIAMNGFIAMTEDIYNAYDLVILSDYNPAGYIKTANAGGVYTAYAERMQLDDNLAGSTGDAALSGNDLTGKALKKLQEYIRKGKPFIAAESIYEGLKESTAAADARWDTRVYQLSRHQLFAAGISQKNIRCEQSDLSEIVKLDYCHAPAIRADASLKCSYAGDIAQANYSVAEISNGLLFTGRIGETAGAKYRLKIYFDKDGNGLYTDESMDAGESELYFDGQVTTGADGSFSVKVMLPGGLRGYVAWKAVAAEPTSGYSSQDTGAVVIRYEETEIREVRVLQIVPAESVDSSNLKMNSSTFKSLFAEISSVVGLKLNVTAMTIADFEALYRAEAYTAGTDYNNSRKNHLWDYSMVVFGFADNFNTLDISNEYGALDNVMDYIQKGNSVLFSHDTMIYSAYSDGNLSNEVYKKDGKTFYTSYYMTSFFRDIIGQDRFHASSVNNGLPFQQGFTNAFLMKRATYNGEKYAMYESLSAGAAGKNTTITTDQVVKLNQGQVTQYPYLIPDQITVAGTHSQWFQLDLESVRADYSESAEDVVVWYTLGGTETKDIRNSGIQMHNVGWQIDSRGEFVYGADTPKYGNTAASGQIPSGGNYITFTPVADGNITVTDITVKKNDVLYVVSEEGKIVKQSAKASAADKERKTTAKVEGGKTYYIYTGKVSDTYTKMKSIAFEASATKSSATWNPYNIFYWWNDLYEPTLFGDPVIPVNADYKYSNYYDLSGQDALNNYYIYSKGNITYSGAGHSAMGEDANAQELKLFVNTIVKAIKSGNNRPEIYVENALDKGSGIYEQFVRADDENVSVTFTPSDIDMGVAHGAFSSGLIYWDVDQDSTYTEGIDVALKVYDHQEVLRNLETVTVGLGTFYDVTAPGTQKTLREELLNNRLTVGIQATDAHDSTGQAVVKLIRRNLFRLD